MAAADYYNPGGQQTGGHPPAPVYPPQQQHPPQQPHMLSANPPYPMSDAPPPYSAFPDPPRPHSQPPPQQRPPTNDQYRPPQAPNGPPPNHGFPPDKNGRPAGQVHNMYKPSDFGGSYTPQPYQQPPQQQHPQDYFPLAGTPAMAQVYGNGSNNGRRPSTTPGYRPPRSPYRDDYKGDVSASRSRSSSRSRHKKHYHHDRPQIQRKKSSGVNTFLGAGGGALIGDAIFPGLGTLGGAILGGLGGHEYGKHRSHSNPKGSRGRSYSNDFDYGDEYRRGRKY